MTDTHFKELQKKNPFASLNDLIYEELVHQIVCQELSAGDRINEAAIAKVLQVSRSPVSAAVGRLREQGFVEKDGGKMPRVTQVSRQEYFQLMEARKAVEGQAAYLAAKRITVQELAQLKEMLGEWKQDSFESRYSQENSQFHGLIVEASHNEVLLGFYRQMQNKLLGIGIMREHARRPGSFWESFIPITMPFTRLCGIEILHRLVRKSGRTLIRCAIVFGERQNIWPSCGTECWWKCTHIYAGSGAKYSWIG